MTPAGRSQERMGRAHRDRWRERVFLMTRNCAHTREKRDTTRDLEQSLRALQTDQLGLRRDACAKSASFLCLPSGLDYRPGMGFGETF